MAYGNNQIPAQRLATAAIAANCIIAEDERYDGQCVQATANRGRLIGIGPVYAISASEMTQITIAGVAQLKIGSGGCAAGDRLISDASGNGVKMATGGTTPQHTVGIAVRSAAQNDIIPVQVEIETMAPGADYLS